MTYLDPCASAAGKDNSLYILSESAMLNMSNCHHFVVAQQPVITGLEIADVFEFHPIHEVQTCLQSHAFSMPSGLTVVNETKW